jgi:hypothetical protein
VAGVTENELLAYMANTKLIPGIQRRENGRYVTMRPKRTIYEAGKGARLEPSGHFYLDYATYGGTSEEVPKSLIDRLEREKKLVRAFLDHPEINAWVLPVGETA